MRLLTLDPSLTCTGYAVMESVSSILGGGLIRPARPDGPDGPDGREEPAHRRAWSMAIEAEALLDEYRCEHVLIELPDGRVHRRIAGSSRGAGLSLYGLAAGVVYAVLSEAVLRGDGRRLHVVTPGEWTGSHTKARRLAGLRLRFPGVDFARDRGLDMADAIGMGVWWFERGREREKARR